MRRAPTSSLVVALVLSMAIPVRAQDAGTPDPPGRSVELRAGDQAPWDGNLSDKERWAAVLAKRRAAEARADLLDLQLQDARASRDAATSDRDSRVSWGVLVGVTGAALVLGLVGGVALVYAAKQ